MSEPSTVDLAQQGGYRVPERHRDLYAGCVFPPKPNMLTPEQVVKSKPAWAEAFDLKRSEKSQAVLAAIQAGTQEEIRLRARMMASVDEGVGQILAALERAGYDRSFDHMGDAVAALSVAPVSEAEAPVEAWRFIECRSKGRIVHLPAGDLWLDDEPWSVWIDREQLLSGPEGLVAVRLLVVAVRIREAVPLPRRQRDAVLDGVDEHVRVLRPREVDVPRPVIEQLAKRNMIAAPQRHAVQLHLQTHDAKRTHQQFIGAQLV